MPRTLMLVYSSPTSAEQEQEYNDWYTNKHLADVVALPGIVAATRYKLEKSVALDDVSQSACTYLAIYEIEGDTLDDMNAAKAALADGLEKGTVDVSPALEFSTLQTDFAKQITDRVEG